MKNTRLSLSVFMLLALTTSTASADMSGTLLKAAPFSACAGLALGYIVYASKKKSHKENPDMFPDSPNLLKHLACGAALGAALPLSGAGICWSTSKAFLKLKEVTSKHLKKKFGIQEEDNSLWQWWKTPAVVGKTTWYDNPKCPPVTFDLVKTLNSNAVPFDSENNLCPSCSSNPHQMYTLSCGHQFCRSCLYQKRRTSEMCPDCNSKMRIYKEKYL